MGNLPPGLCNSHADDHCQDQIGPHSPCQALGVLGRGNGSSDGDFGDRGAGKRGGRQNQVAEEGRRLLQVERIEVRAKRLGVAGPRLTPTVMPRPIRPAQNAANSHHANVASPPDDHGRAIVTCRRKCPGDPGPPGPAGVSEPHDGSDQGARLAHRCESAIPAASSHRGTVQSAADMQHAITVSARSSNDTVARSDLARVT